MHLWSLRRPAARAVCHIPRILPPRHLGLRDCFAMDTEIAPLLISSIAALSGVAITAIFAELRERRRASSEERRMERSERQEHFKWLRQERRLLYAALILSLDKAVEQYSKLLDSLLLDNSMARSVDPATEEAILMEDLRGTSREVAKQVFEIQVLGSEEALEAANAASESLEAIISLLRHMNEATPRIEAEAFIRTSQVWIDLQNCLARLTEAARVDLGSPSGSLGPNI